MWGVPTWEAASRYAVLPQAHQPSYQPHAQLRQIRVEKAPLARLHKLAMAASKHHAPESDVEVDTSAYSAAPTSTIRSCAVWAPNTQLPVYTWTGTSKAAPAPKQPAETGSPAASASPD